MKSLAMAVVKPGCPACDQMKPALAKAHLHQINADTHPSMVEDLGVEAFPDVVYRTHEGTLHHMPWGTDGTLPDAAAIVRWIDQTRSGKPRSGKPPPSTGKKPECAKCSAQGGVPPSVWGPPLWFVIHVVALMHPQRPTPAQKKNARAFFTGLEKVLPCSYCQKHFAAELATMDPGVFASRDALFGWTVDFHTRVNQRTHSTQIRHTPRYWRDHYKRLIFNSRN